MNIIEIENLTYSYPAAKSPILKNISLTVEEGDFLAVVGNNGCGKSTFCKTLNGLIPHFIDGRLSPFAGWRDGKTTISGSFPGGRPICWRWRALFPCGRIS